MMILIRLDSDDWLDIDDHVCHMLGPKYIIDLKDEYTDHVEERYTAELIYMSLVFVSEDLISVLMIDVVGLIFVSILGFTLDYTL